MQRKSGDAASDRQNPLPLDALLPASRSDPVDFDLAVTDASQNSVSSSIPEQIGRYRVASLVGTGGYGRVFKAFDDKLQRHVAIKLPHRYRITSDQSLETYLDEARTLAKLDHPGIVTVHDVGVTEDGVPYIVSPYIDGTSLAHRMQSEPFTLRAGLELVTDVARALAYVHSQGVVHRDVKPENILLSRDEKPFLADFGLALRDETAESGRVRVGTPAYMSPEQARGESHLVDGRSDIFSLGIVLYEMLTGKRPFGGRDRDSMVYSLLNQEVRPPRQLSSSIPRDLERICLKMLAKRASHRYSTSGDLIEDIEHFLSTFDTGDSQASTQLATDASAPSSHLTGVIPRGLRSYDRHDASFFSRLLPGPRDRDWVPESLRFWQRQIDSTDVADPPRVGVVYGPSGCGKSSFVKAGLLPLLGNDIAKVFVEATRDDTESRLLRGIRKRCPDLDARLNLAETLAQVRRDHRMTNGRRLLVVIDQFEQWLHGRSDQTDPELANALRQCDGHTIQCLLLVRDDFWLALSRFMSILEVPLRQNHNAMLVDLFSTTHARRVLAELGVAYDRLPENMGEFTSAQSSFLDRVVQGLSEGGKIFPVRLSLFVEMVKSQPWEISTLTSLGGVHGIGLQFLEEEFSSDLAPAAQRTHEPAVRRVLRKLLPEKGLDIKGNMQPEQLLLDESGYKNDPRRFQEMMRILDTDLRLVTPTDPAGTTSSDESYSQSGDGVRYFQLTHDYLVPAIEQWLTRKQRETRRGRAELRLAEYSSVWTSNPSSKYLPSYLDWLSVRFWSSPQRWNSGERKMMRLATRRHMTSTLIGIAALLVFAFTLWWVRAQNRASALTQQLQTARTEQIRRILDDLGRQSSIVVSPLSEALENAPAQSHAEIVNRLALLPHDRSHHDALVQQSVQTQLPMVLLLKERLAPLQGKSQDFLLKTLKEETDGAIQLRAAIMLAGNASMSKEDEQSFWRQHAQAIANEVLRHATVAPQENVHLLSGLEPIHRYLVAPLRSTALEKEDSPARSLATSFLVQFLREEPSQLLDFLLDASFQQHQVIMPTLAAQLSDVVPQIREIAFSEIDQTLAEEQFDKLAKRKGTAAALLHRLGMADATWPLLRGSEWPHARGYLIHRIAPLGGNFDVILSRFSRESQVSIRRALLFVLGEFDTDSISNAAQLQATSLVKDAFENDPDVGTHSAAQWVLLRWGESEWIRESVLKQSTLSRDPRKNWYVNAEGQTMAVFDARDVPAIGRVFEIGTAEVTVDEYLRFKPEHYHYEYRSPTPDCPIGMMNWFRCLDYCRWLSERLDADPDHCYPADLTPRNPDVDYDDVLQHGAYRLPTLAEWRYACAAMTTSRRYYGFADELAGDHYWHWGNSLNEDGDVRYYPAGLKKPNDFGMFAMYDGVREWGHDRTEFDRRAVMGFASSTELERMTTFPERRTSDLSKAINGYYGLRLARTVVDRDR